MRLIKRLFRPFLKALMLALKEEEAREVERLRPEHLECWDNGQIFKGKVIGTLGLHVQIQLPNKTLLVGESSAVSPEEFWEVWRSWSKDKVTWGESNEEFSPS